jgi:hypothetical protein
MRGASRSRPALVVLLVILPLTGLLPAPGGATLERLSSLPRTLAALAPSLAEHLAGRAALAPATYTAGGQPVRGLAVTEPAPPLDAAPPPDLLPVEREAWLARARRAPAAAPVALAPYFPATFTDPFLVEAQGLQVGLRPLGARPAAAALEEGKVVYRDAYRETDSLHAVSAGRSEEFLLLRGPAAPARFEYELLPGPTVTQIAPRDGGVRFSDAAGNGLLIEAPWLVEAGGQRRQDVVRWELGPPVDGLPRRLALVLAPAGLRYPLVIDPSWVATTGMATARYMHTATLLPNGKVLVAGGCCDASGALASSELYDPLANSWTATGALATGRFRHTATLLPNGKVLVAGGEQHGKRLASAELYDPAKGSWASTGSLAKGRKMHTATLLLSGKVLVVGGSGPDDEALASAELYDPASGSWSDAGSLTRDGRRAHTATRLGNGEVLVVGGFGGGSRSSLTSVEIYNPNSPPGSAWRAGAGLRAARSFHTATLLPDGTVLVAGGLGGSGNALASADIYSPGSNSWTPVGGLATARYSHTATLLPNGTVLVTGGFGTAALTSSELYSGGGWSATNSLGVARLRHTATLLPDGRVLVAGGDSGGGAGILTSAERYEYATASWSQTNSLATGRYNHTATLLPDGRVLVAGGYTKTAEIYNPINGTWSPTGSMNEVRARHAAVLLPNGKVLVIGGKQPSGGGEVWLDTTELYDPATGTWSSAGYAPCPVSPNANCPGKMQEKRAVFTATLLANRRVLVAGGEPVGGATNQVTNKAELYDPETGAWTLTGSLKTGRSKHTATLLTNGKLLVAGGHGANFSPLISSELYDPTTGAWSTAGNAAGPSGSGIGAVAPSASCTSVPSATCPGPIKAFRFYHTAALLHDGRVLAAAGHANGNDLASAEVYDPATGQWTFTGNLATARHDHSETVLHDGQVLVVGGSRNDIGLASAELYDPARGQWTTIASMPDGDGSSTNEVAGRGRHTAILLPTSQILVAGGDSGPANPGGFKDKYKSVLLFDAGLGFSEAWRPVLNNATNPLGPDAKLTVVGSGFRGRSGASGGNMGQDSPADYPLLHLRSLVNEQARYLIPDAGSWSDTGFTALPLQSFPMGFALATVIVNGIPSISRVIMVETDANNHVAVTDTTMTLTSSANPATAGQQVTLTATVVTAVTGQGTPAGSVSFKDGGTTLCGLVPLDGTGRATCVTTFGVAGSHALTAEYTTADASKYKGGTSAVLTQQVTGNKGSTTALVSSLNPSVVGQGVAFTASVRPAATGATLPDGRVTFFNDGAVIPGCANLALDSLGQATCNATGLAAGIRQIRAEFTPSGSAFSASASPALAQTVSQRREWRTLLVENFEGDLQTNNWDLDGAPTWAPVTCAAAGGRRSGWPGGSGGACSGVFALEKENPAWLVWGPFNLANAGQALLDFQMRRDLQPDDEVWVLVSTDNIDFQQGRKFLGSSGGSFQPQTIDLSDVDTTGRINMLGKPQVWIAFFFRSQGDAFGNGPYIDDVVLKANVPVAPVSWAFAEGYTGGSFEEYLTILNRSGDRPAQVSLTYYLAGGATVNRSLTVAPRSRATVFVNDVAVGVGRGQAVSAQAESTNGADILVERPMYFDYNGWTGGHNVMGAPAPQTAWYFAEGYTGGNFHEYLTIQNPNASPGTAEITYYLEGGGTEERTVNLPANSRTTITVHADPSPGNPGGLGRGRAHSTKVTTRNLPGGIVVERPMYFDYNGWTGGHNVMGAPAPRAEWYFAEGWTGAGFDEYLTIMNPNDTPATVLIGYVLSTGPLPDKVIQVAARSRRTVVVHDAAEGVGRNQAVSARVRTTHPGGIVVERPMYFTYKGWTGGHNVMGAAAPQTSWSFAEGYTGAGFDEYLTIMNPNPSPAAVTITYFLTGGATVIRFLSVEPLRRSTVLVNDPIQGVGPNQAVAAQVTTANSGGIVVERPMYFNYKGTITGGHVVMGYPG